MRASILTRPPSLQNLQKILISSSKGALLGLVEGLRGPKPCVTSTSLSSGGKLAYHALVSKQLDFAISAPLCWPAIHLKAIVSTPKQRLICV